MDSLDAVLNGDLAFFRNQRHFDEIFELSDRTRENFISMSMRENRYALVKFLLGKMDLPQNYGFTTTTVSSYFEDYIFEAGPERWKIIKLIIDSGKVDFFASDFVENIPQRFESVFITLTQNLSGGEEKRAHDILKHYIQDPTRVEKLCEYFLIIRYPEAINDNYVEQIMIAPTIDYYTPSDSYQTFVIPKNSRSTLLNKIFSGCIPDFHTS